MKVGYAPEVPIGDQTLRYNRPADFSQFTTSIEKGLGAFEGAANTYLERQTQAQHYKALSDLTDLDQQTQDQLTELKRSSVPGSTDLLPQADKIINDSAQKFMEAQPDRVKPFIQYHVEKMRTSYHSDILDFQYKQNDAFYKTDLTQKLEDAKNIVWHDPSQLEPQRAKMAALTKAADIPEAAKVEMTANSDNQLRYLAEHTATMNRPLGGSGAVPLQQGTPVPDPYYVRLKEVESSGGKNTYNPYSKAAGDFAFEPSTAVQYGLPRDARQATPEQQLEAVKKLTEDNRAVLRNALGREPSMGELYLAHQQGTKGALSLLLHPNDPVGSRVPDHNVTANGGNLSMTAGQFANMWINRFEGSVQPGSTVVMEQPGLTFEQRQRIEQDASANAQAQIKSVTPDILASVKQTGQYTGPEPNFADFQRAYHAGALAEYQQFQNDRATAVAMNQMQSQPDSEITATVMNAKNAISTGPGAAEDIKRYQILADAANQTRTERNKAPMDYVIGHNDMIKNAWTTFDPHQPQASSGAISLGLAEQARLGVPYLSRQPLPTAVAAAAAQIYGDKSRPDEQQADAIISTVLMSNDPDTQHQIIRQLESAGAPKALEAVVEAGARGDLDAAHRLYTAAVTPPKDLTAKVDKDESDRVSVALDDSLFHGADSVGQLLYGLDQGQSANVARANSDKNLAMNEYHMLRSQGKTEADAEAIIARDLLGGQVRVNTPLPGGDGRVDIAVPGNEAEAYRPGGLLNDPGPRLLPLRVGFQAELPKVRGAILEHVIDEQVGGPEIYVSQSINVTTADRIVNAGSFRPYDITNKTVGFFDSFSGKFVAGKDGKPLQWNVNDVLAKGQALITSGEMGGNAVAGPGAGVSTVPSPFKPLTFEPQRGPGAGLGSKLVPGRPPGDLRPMWDDQGNITYVPNKP